MKIVVIGGTGLIGSQLVTQLRTQGHDVVPASPNTGVSTITREGLDQALAGAQVVVDVANSPSFEDQAVMAFFQTSGRNLLAAEARAGVAHHVTLSVVGTERLQDSGYFRAKLAQEALVQASPVPYTIVRATQFFEFMSSIAGSATQGDTVRLSSAAMQPIASADVAEALAVVAVAQPLNGQMELAGPQRAGMADFVRQYLQALGDARRVVSDPAAPYFGTVLDDRSLTPADAPMLGRRTFTAWLAQQPRTA